MAVHHNREAFIPYSRQEIIELCIADGVAIADQQNFRDFCDILAAYYHFKLHHALEDLKADFVSFDPDSVDGESSKASDNLELKHQELGFIKTFESILKQANV